MKGYKAFDNNLKCRGFQYEIGKTYTFDGDPIPCKQGFHFCKSIAECYEFYPQNTNTRICEVDAIGDIATDDEVKYCTNKITIGQEIVAEWERRGNANASSSPGYCNTGNRNTGNWNTGNRNTGNWNTGDWNTGNWNTGNRNTGNRNTGDWNTGDWNTGNRNTGDWNTGNWNTGDWNTGNWNTGVFCTEIHKILFFDKESDMTYEDWRRTKACYLLNSIPKKIIDWIREENMTEKEKEANPSYKTTGGYLKISDESSAAQTWWDGLTDDDKQAIYDIPNFNAEKFEKCTGIKVGK